MLPPIFKTLNTPDIRQMVGENPVRIYDFGHAPDGTLPPYIVFTQISGAPYEQISGVPSADKDLVQIDCYTADRVGCRRLAQLVQTALDNVGQSNRMIIQDYESETALYRIGLEVDWISARA
ncbi:DUF3168 domain-containing protein [Neisseria weixii]|uniref:DUF3168 domain-containing protein n=1 Tax=Neisseria weixii TaxID=1853276 RepID=A0A3N4N585_9NEIS|nr:DUF3168 domain-containing protein [Neisseria weixii]RPD90515.1 DUF3168 domain-containing protein [Neisseria weixii]RPD90543.1 DUF3168 domain-containing protein [Neisseria weixii]